MKTEAEVKAKIKLFEESIKTIMLPYLNAKLGEEDYHRVEDAASDIRDIISARAALEWVLG